MIERYGVPYMGSKNDIAEQIIEIVPQARNFYDLFAGGCAVTHAAMLSGKFRNFIANDLQGMGVQLFIDSMAGKYANETRWISRDDFVLKKDTDPYIALCWSFGNNMQTYMYSVEIEEWKHALHNAYILNDMRLLWAIGINPHGDTRQWIRKHEKECLDKYIQWYFESKSMPVPTYEDMRKTDELLNATKSEALNMLQKAYRESGLKPKQINEHTHTFMFSHWFNASQWQFPTPDMYRKLCEIMPTLPSADGYEYVYITKRLQRLQILQHLQSLQRLQILQSLESLQRLQRLQSLKSLQRLQSLQSLPIIKIMQKSYNEIHIEENSVIYCDPPYNNTVQYVTGDFDTNAFFDWCRKQKELVVVSEYDAPDDFQCVANFNRRSKFQGGTKVEGCGNAERLFVRRNQMNMFNRQKLFNI